MSTVISVLETSLPVFAALALGMLCRSRNLLSRDGVAALKRVAVDITLPAVLFHAFASAEYSLSTIAIPVTVYLLCAVTLGLGMVCIRLSGMKSRLAPFLASGFEVGMLGYALFLLLFRDQSASHLAIPDLGHTLFVFTLYKILLTGKGGSWRSIVKEILSSPIIWALIAGTVVGATGLYGYLGQIGVSGVLDAVTDFISAPTGTIILLTVGYDLVLKEIPWKQTAGLLAMRLLTCGIFLGLMLLVNRTLLGGSMMEGAIVLMAILPPPYIIPVFTDEPEERVRISAALSSMTLMTLVLFVVLSVIL